MKTIHIFAVSAILALTDIAVLKVTQDTPSAIIWGGLVLAAATVMVMAAKEIRGE
jgi:hypothetical protein